MVQIGEVERHRHLSTATPRDTIKRRHAFGLGDRYNSVRNGASNLSAAVRRPERVKRDVNLQKMSDSRLICYSP